MWRPQYQVSLRIDELSLALRVTPPKHEYQVVALTIQQLDNFVGKSLPAPTLVRRRTTTLDGKHAVQQQDTLPGPVLETAVGGNWTTNISRNFCKYVDQRGRCF